MKKPVYKRWAKLSDKAKRKLIEDWEDGTCEVRIGKDKEPPIKCVDGVFRTIDDIIPLGIGMDDKGRLLIIPVYSGMLPKGEKARKKLFDKFNAQAKKETMVVDDISLAFFKA